MKVKDVIDRLEKFASPELAPCDTPGLLEGYMSSEVNKIGIVLDGTLNTVRKALENDIDFLIVHHGMVGSRTNVTEGYSKKLKLVRDNKIAVYRMHLNLDFCNFGIQWQLSRLFGMENIEAVDMHYKNYYIKQGCYVGTIRCAFREFLENVLKVTKSQEVSVYNYRENKEIKKIALTSGSGFQPGFAEQLMKQHQVDALISGEMTIHGLREGQEAGLTLIATTHYSNEGTGLKKVAQHLDRSVFPDIPVIFLDDSEDRTVFTMEDFKTGSQEYISEYGEEKQFSDITR